MVISSANDDSIKSFFHLRRCLQQHELNLIGNGESLESWPYSATNAAVLTWSSVKKPENQSMQSKLDMAQAHHEYLPQLDMQKRGFSLAFLHQQVG